MEILRLEGAFAPASQRGNELSQARAFPPERFIAAQLCGGLNVLYKRLGNRKKTCHPKHVPGAQTDEDGKFQPCYPVPLLAGRYKFVQVIGQGQSSVLIAAEDTFHPKKRPMAVKIMNLDYSNLGAQEAECIQQLNKADVLKVSRTVQLFNTFNFDSHYCLVFELLRPRPLHQYFQGCQFHNEETKLKVIRKIALQLLHVLGFLKRENVIHADLKPENILIEEGEEIKIKVVDFGNAIHCVYREVSMYYDEFELQTLLYRAPEVMFGVPFGHEIDVWSLGCILAELHIGKPLFFGQTKHEVLQEVISVLGPFPKNPFQSGKFFQDLSHFVGQNPESSQLIFVTNMMKKLLNSRNYAFASFIVGLLHYNPRERLTPYQAAMHPFVGPEFPFCYLLPQQGDKTTDSASGYTNTLLTPDQYVSKPVIQDEVTRRHISGIELLKSGTKVLSSNIKNVHQVSSSVKRQKKETEIKVCSLAKTMNVGTKKSFDTTALTEDSTYILERPLKTSEHAAIDPKYSNSRSYIKKGHKYVHQTITDAQKGISKNNKKRSLNMVDKRMPNMGHILSRDSCILDSYNEMEGSDFDNKSSHAVSSERGSNDTADDSTEYNVRSRVDEVTSPNSSSPIKLGPDVQSAARIRIYCRKSIATKQEHDDLSPESKRSKLGDQNNSQQVTTAAPVCTRAVKKGRTKKIWEDPLQQDLQRAGPSEDYKDDVVLLL